MVQPDREALEDFLVLKNLTEAQLHKLQEGVWSDLLGAASAEFDAEYIRCWRARGGERWSAVVRVDPRVRKRFTKVISNLRSEMQFEVVVMPYLPPAVMELRKQREEVFRSLVHKGLSPKWVGNAEIEYMQNGMKVLYEF